MVSSSQASVGFSSGISKIEETLPDGIHGGITSNSIYMVSPATIYPSPILKHNQQRPS